MGVTLFDSGTLDAVIGTEHFLGDIDEPGVYQLKVDLDELVANDGVEVRVYTKMATGGTPKVEEYGARYGLQSDEDLILVTLPASNDLAETNGLRFSVKQTLGTARDFPWKVLKHA